MLDQVIAEVLKLQNYVIFSVIVGMAFLALHLFFSINLRMKSKRMHFMGQFYGTSFMEQWLIGAIYLRLFFVIWCVAFRVQLDLVHYGFYGVLSFTTIFFLIIKRGGLTDVFGIILIGAGLLTGNLLIEYNRQVRYEVAIEAIYWCLGVFVILYTVYLSCKELGRVSKVRRRKHVQIEVE